ncbi:MULTISPECIES: beta-galactosidase [Pseudomonas]|uniref:Beta-galactosidase n=1 Tax=Pseudomonas wuhanensis TaxID=2954098 RepID=A0ABY9GKZ5_9PSED|nr:MULTISPECIES: beta-galactosidase [unclassified Pseudomonas]WLI10521.1 beta-galactosidase [Pseudomonas sp. FP603]WLI16334.1 beta-galactosidase [Pseudomonas sp. FP607]
MARKYGLGYAKCFARRFGAFAVIAMVAVFFVSQSFTSSAIDYKSFSVPIYSVWVSSAAKYKQLDNKCLAGITYYVGWRKLEPVKGEFNFEGIEELLRSARRHNKKVNLALLTGRWSPDWVLSQSRQVKWLHNDTYTANDINVRSEAPVPWDSAYHANLRQLLTEVAARVLPFKDVINSISVTGGSNTNGIEMNFIASDYELKKVGFTKEEYVNSWVSLARDYHEIFPGIPLSIAVHTHYGSMRTNEISEEVIKRSKVFLKDDLILSALAFTDEKWFKKGNLYADLVLSEPASQRKSLQSIKKYSSLNQVERFNLMLIKAEKLAPSWVEVWADDADAYIKCVGEM